MRLLFVGTNRGLGGTERHFVDLAVAMRLAGHEVEAVAARDDVIWRALVRRGVPLHAAEFTSKVDWAAMRVLRDAVRRLRPDWIVGTFERDYWGTALVASERGVPLALFRHLAVLKQSSLRGLPWLVRRFVLPSEFLRQWAVGRGLPGRRTTVVYNPVDVSRFRPSARRRRVLRAALGFGPDDVVVGYFGQFDPLKGMEVLADALDLAMARRPALRALWLGDGPLAHAMARRLTASSHATRHVRCGWVENVAPYYAALDVLALPSTGPEAFGRVSVEAQASGVPVLGSAIGGIPETLADGHTGFLVPPGDASIWAEAIVGLTDDAELRGRMGLAGREFARGAFDAPVIAAAFARMLAAAAGGDGPG